MWQQACAEPNKLPDRAMFLAQQMSGAAGIMAPGAHHPGMPISEPIPGAKPLPVPPELAALRASGAMGQQVCSLLPLNHHLVHLRPARCAVFIAILYDYRFL